MCFKGQFIIKIESLFSFLIIKFLFHLNRIYKFFLNNSVINLTALLNIQQSNTLVDVGCCIYIAVNAQFKDFLHQRKCVLCNN